MVYVPWFAFRITPCLEVLVFAFQGRGGKPRMKNKSLHGEGRRLSVRAVKAAVCAFIGAKRRALTEGADGENRFQQSFVSWIRVRLSHFRGINLLSGATLTNQ